MKKIFVIVFLVCLAPCGALAQVSLDTPGWFVFDMPGLDAPEGGAADMTALSAEKAGQSGGLRVEGGHFVDGAGKRLRLFGVNLTGDSCFPDAEKAPRLAKRLAQLGFNVVRMHFMDYVWRGGSIWEDPKTGKLSEDSLRRLDNLIAELAKRGIYTNINLHVARNYPGQPSWPGDRIINMGKTLDRWYPPYVALLEQYARDLMTRKNTVTGKRYAEDPAIAVVEINNENTMIMDLRAEYTKIQGPIQEEFQREWTAWLKKKYGSTEALAVAWNKDAQPLGAELLKPGQWRVQNSGGAESTLKQEGARLVWDVAKLGTEGWHLQMQYKGLTLASGRHTWSMRVRSRSPKPLRLSLSLMLDVAPWDTRGLRDTITVGSEWQTISITGDVEPSPAPGQLRLNIGYAGDAAATFEFEDVSLRAGGGAGLPKDQTLEAGVGIPGRDSVRAVMDDFWRFLIETEMATTKRIVAFLKKEIGCKAPIADTQISYGGAAGVLRETMLCDYTDIHGYWQHPSYTYNEKGQTIAFRIPNSTQVAEASGGTLSHIAFYRVKDRPLSVSEYNTPSPNDHGAELFPLLTGVAALQDWDALYGYTYRDFGQDYENTALKKYFHLIGRPNILVHAPASALLFRQARLVTASDAKEGVELHIGKSDVPRLVSERKDMTSVARDLGIDTGAAWLRKVKLSLDEGAAPPSFTGDGKLPQGLRASASGAMQWHPDDPAGAWYSLNCPSVRLLVGRVGGRSFEVGDVTFAIEPRPWPKPGAAYACVSLAALDGQPIAKSARLLLAASARSENCGMPWNADRTSIPVDNWGKPPTLCEAVPLSLRLPAPPTRAVALDANGREGKALQVQNGCVLLRAEDKTLWALITR
ncbi:MAG: cellulase family glycosylhydrolase [Candidatus Sumerlaeota bacterium]|nr:cellulase family glycosylhydrolase [Candidatus Sumerlaeota bacterium]